MSSLSIRKGTSQSRDLLQVSRELRLSVGITGLGATGVGEGLERFTALVIGIEPYLTP